MASPKKEYKIKTSSQPFSGGEGQDIELRQISLQASHI